MKPSAFPWPRLPGSAHVPRWTGRGFQVGDALVPVLSYPCGDSGWTDELTSFHEDVAGGSHPLDRASRRHALEQVERHVGDRPATILEVGCSSGFMLEELRARFPAAEVIGADYVRGPLDALAQRQPEIPLLQFDLTQCPLPDESVDAVVLLNVLEHIADDVAAMTECWRILRPGGVAVIEVPAGPHLYDTYDRLLMHHRRYALGELCGRLESAGFELRDRSHLGMFLYPAFRAVKLRNQRKPLGDVQQQQASVARQIRSSRNLLLQTALGVEMALGRWLSYPWGIRCLATARKPLSQRRAAAA